MNSARREQGEPIRPELGRVRPRAWQPRQPQRRKHDTPPRSELAALISGRGSEAPPSLRGRPRPTLLRQSTPASTEFGRPISTKVRPGGAMTTRSSAHSPAQRICRIVSSISACYAEDPGSTPAGGGRPGSATLGASREGYAPAPVGRTTPTRAGEEPRRLAHLDGRQGMVEQQRSKLHPKGPPTSPDTSTGPGAFHYPPVRGG